MRPVDPRLLRHAGAVRGYLAVTAALGLVTTGLVLAQAGLLARALATAARGAGGTTLAGTLTALLAVTAARAAASFGGEAAALRAAAAVKSQLRRKLAAHLLRLGPGWLGSQHPGELTTLATRGLDALDPWFARCLPQLVLAGLVPLAVLARVALADWPSALIIAVTLPLVPVFAVLIGLHTRAATQRQWQLLARLGGHFLDVVQGLGTLRLLRRADAQAASISRATDAHRAATMATLRVAFLSALVLEMAAALATALVAVEVGLRLLGGHLGYQTALLVLLLTPEAYLPLRTAAGQYHASLEGAAAAARICDVLGVPVPAPRGRSGPPQPPDLRETPIVLNEVTLRYPGRPRPALAGVSLTIAPGERLALTGASGAGKSSLLALLLRFAEPTSGRIEAGGADLLAFPPEVWRQQLAWVPQRPHLFAGTAAANIALGQPRVSRAAVTAAAELAGAAEFIEALPRGYDTPLGERAARLSAGQRQRIALARAFLRDAPLLLLDEPAAHLDPVTGAAVLDAVETLMARCTVLLVTHGRAGRAGADRVLTLDHGRLVLAAGCLPARAQLAGTP
jgi:ATP-binding cassette subfamily C protein CydD